jgi:chromosome partitioning protein
VSAPIIAFFNSRARVGTTTAVYHLAWMFSDLGVRVLAVDLDPQGNLTSLFFREEYIEKTLWESAAPVSVESIADPYLYLIPAFPSGPRPRIDVVLNRVADPTDTMGFDVVLLDLGTAAGPDALLAADYVIIPLTADFLAVQGMIAVGKTLNSAELAVRGPRPLGYILQNRPDRLRDPSGNWLARIPGEFRRSVLGYQQPEAPNSVGDDKWCLALLKHYHGLMPMAQEAHKPMFHLTVADGAIGAHFEAAQSAAKDFEKLARRITEAVGLKLPHFSGA